MEIENSGSDQAEVTSTSKIQTHRKLGKLVAQPMCSPRHSSRIRAPRHARSRCRSRQWSRERPQSACGITQCWHHCKTPWKQMLDYHLSKVWSAFTCVTMTMLQMFTPLASLTWGSRPKRTRGTFRNWNTESKLLAQPKVTVSKYKMRIRWKNWCKGLKVLKWDSFYGGVPSDFLCFDWPAGSSGATKPSRPLATSKSLKWTGLTNNDNYH